MKTKNKKYLIWSLSSLLISIFLSLPIFATDIQIEGYITGGLTIISNGDWTNTLQHSGVSHNPSYNQTATWTSTPMEDYISFIDDTNTTGFHITMSMTDLEYTGNSTTQGSLSASNFTLYPQYNVNGPVGYDDPSYGISILPNSCSTVTPASFMPHDDLMDPNTNFGLSLTNSSKITLISNADCLNIGHLRLDRTEILVPAGTAVGNYTATITMTIIDGIPS